MDEMRSKIIGVSGKKQAGKNTMCDALYNYLGPESCRIYSFADALKKKVCIEVMGLTHAQCYGNDEQKNSLTNYKWENLPTDVLISNNLGYEEAGPDRIMYPKLPFGFMTAREIMQVVGTDIFRNYFDDNIWVNATFRQIKKDSYRYALISDIRFPSEVEGVLENGGTIIRLMRDVCESDSHSSETALDNFDFNREECIIFDNRNMTIEEQGKNIISMLFGN
jgi:hypothetical protein